MALSKKALRQLLTTCLHCSAPFEQLISTMITQNHRAELVHVHCRTCQGSLIALLLSTGPFISSIGLISDLSREDVIRFQYAQTVSEDDLFLLHEELRQTEVVSDLMAQSVLNA